MRARDLIVQEFDRNGDLWATRGMLLYRLHEGEDKFVKMAHVPTGFSVFWLRNFTLVRRFTLRPECVEVVVTEKGDLCVLSAGTIWVLPAGEKKFHKTMQLDHYGFGDQGVRNDGILSIGESTIYFGEYFRNSERGGVNVFTSKDDLTSWRTAYEFSPGKVRHIHGIQRDPYTGKLWICTGDLDPESIIAWTDNNFDTIQAIGSGSQMWRTCQLVFTEESVYWGTDTSEGETTGIYKWNKGSGEIEKLLEPDGAVFFGTRLKGGTILMSTDRQGYKNEKDDRTRLYIIDKKDRTATIDCGTWNHNKPGFWFKFAQLRFQRNQGNSSLVISCINQTELPDGDLIMINESELVNALD
jgi:hypothetical protein